MEAFFWDCVEDLASRAGDRLEPFCQGLGAGLRPENCGRLLALAARAALAERARARFFETKLQEALVMLGQDQRRPAA